MERGVHVFRVAGQHEIACGKHSGGTGEPERDELQFVLQEVSVA
jgi:hypothetical protein